MTVVSLAAPTLWLELLGGLLVCWKASIEPPRFGRLVRFSDHAL